MNLGRDARLLAEKIAAELRLNELRGFHFFEAHRHQPVGELVGHRCGIG